MNIISRIPQDLGDYIDHFNCDNLKDLQTHLTDIQDWEKEEYNMNKHHDLDWIKHDIHSYIKLYESGELNTAHKEQCIHIVAGESVSLASALRKNKSRTIGSISAIKRITSGYKCDINVRERKANHEEANEFGAGETGIKSSGTNHIVEGEIKLPKALKDMIDSLIFNNNGGYEGSCYIWITTAWLEHDINYSR
ncbi:hypothetical protein G6F56_005965 [Rhizopus delemar]|nr:hypothetical protein G6F56_005965 [Rhizopus delemar]